MISCFESSAKPKVAFGFANGYPCQSQWALFTPLVRIVYIGQASTHLRRFSGYSMLEPYSGRATREKPGRSKGL
jgi:hypothetical protein